MMIAYDVLTFLFTRLSLHFQARCRRRRLNLAFVFLWYDFMLYVFFSYGCMLVFVVFDLLCLGV